jgi:hypothetical protein
MNERVAWLAYDFTVYPATGVTWGDVGGVYIFAGHNPQNQWQAYYVGQTESFQRRLPGHERWKEAARMGATDIHARVVQQALSRDAIERELIHAFQPPLNT